LAAKPINKFSHGRLIDFPAGRREVTQPESLTHSGHRRWAQIRSPVYSYRFVYDDKRKESGRSFDGTPLTNTVFVIFIKLFFEVVAIYRVGAGVNSLAITHGVISTIFVRNKLGALLFAVIGYAMISTRADTQ